MLRRPWCQLTIAALAVACAGSGPDARDASRSTTGLEDGRLAPAPERRVSSANVEELKLEFQGVRASDQSEIEGYALLDELSRADVVCLGADPDRAAHHWAEWVVLQGLLERARISGREVGLGMQMFEHVDQDALDEYLSEAEPDEPKLLAQTRWNERRKQDFGLYRPLFATARRRHIPILALNAPRELTDKIAKDGLRTLTDEERSELSHLHFGDAEHHDLFRAQNPSSGRADLGRRQHAAHLVSEETIAETASAWIAERQPARQLLIVADADSCRKPAVPRRLLRRVDCRLVTVRPILEHTGADVTTVLQQYDYAMVMQKPQ